MRVCIISKYRGINVKKYLLKHKSDKEKNLKYDFLPSIIEIVEKPTNAWGSVIIVFSLLLFVSVGLWAAFSKFDVVVSVGGMIATDDGIAKVESMAGGEVEQIVVKEGDYVETGDVIVRLDTQFIDEAMDNLKYQKEILEVQKAVYLMISEGEDITKLDSETYDEHKWIVEAMVEEEKMYQSTMDEYDRQEKLGTEVEYIQYERENFELSRKAEVASAISQCELQIWQCEEELKTYEENLEFYTIKANASGYVTQLQVLSEKEVVSAGDMIAYIVNKNELIFECYVPDSEIAEVELDQKVNVKISAYPYNDYGMFEGTVIEISDISVQNENYGNVYVVKVLMEEKEDAKLTIGMGGMADIVIGERSALEYFLEPIKQGLDDSFKEK